MKTPEGGKIRVNWGKEKGKTMRQGPQNTTQSSLQSGEFGAERRVTGCGLELTVVTRERRSEITEGKPSLAPRTPA